MAAGTGESGAVNLDIAADEGLHNFTGGENTVTIHPLTKADNFSFGEIGSRDLRGKYRGGAQESQELEKVSHYHVNPVGAHRCAPDFVVYCCRNKGACNEPLRQH